MSQLGFHVNLDNCIGCRACEGACKQEFELPVGVRRRRVVAQEGEDDAGPWTRFVSLACNHCDAPACVKACPVQRLFKDDPARPEYELGWRARLGMTAEPTGLVLMAPSRAQDPAAGVDCTGCKRCIGACPYGAMQWDPVHQVSDKCTGCYHRLANDSLPPERRQPACVVTCTARALHFDRMADIEAGLHGAASRYTTAQRAGVGPRHQLADVDMTRPNVRFTPARRVP
jgi:anaerobic dimethyl sulfoxide reductase subunit B (iron-sulfur subunit)